MKGMGTMSKRLERRFFLWMVARRRKYFWAWLATWVGVLLVTYFLEIPLQSPFPSFSSPTRNARCSSSVHATPTYIYIHTFMLINLHKYHYIYIYIYIWLKVSETNCTIENHIKLKAVINHRSETRMSSSRWWQKYKAKKERYILKQSVVMTWQQSS